MKTSAARIRRGVAVLALAAGLGVTLLASWDQARRNDIQLASRLQAEATRIADDVVDRIGKVELAVQGARSAALAIGWDALTREHFQRYDWSRDVEHEMRGMQGIGVIRRVKASDEQRFRAAATADDWFGFEVQAWAPHDRERFVVQYIEPALHNRSAVGLDIASEPTRRKAAERALQTGKATLTAPITLVQRDTNEHDSVLLLVPVYPSPEAAANIAQRADLALGWTYAPIAIPDLLAEVGMRRDLFQLHISDVTDEPAKKVYGAASAAQAELRTTTVRIIGARHWLFELRALPGFAAAQELPMPGSVALIGALISTLAAAVLHAYLRMREHRRELRVERERRALVLQSARDAVLMVDLDGRLMDFNQGAEALLGYSASELIGQVVRPFVIPPEHETAMTAMEAQCLRGETPPMCEAEGLHRDGRRIAVSVAMAPMHDADGAVVGLAISMRDIRAAKRAEREIQDLATMLEKRVDERTEALNETRRDLQMVLDAMPSQISYWDHDLRLRAANRAFCDAVHSDADTLHGRHARDQLGASLFARTLPRMHAALSGEAQTYEESWHRRGDGSICYSLVQLLPDHVDGRVRGFYAFVHDVTELQAAQRRLHQLASTLQAVVDASSEVAIVAIDTDAIVRVFNRGAERLLGYSADDAVGKLSATAFHDRALLDQRAALLARDGSATALDVLTDPAWLGDEREWIYRKRDGTPVTVATITTPMYDADGRLTGYVSVAQDITQRRAVEQQLEHAKSKAEAANRAKSEFLAVTSHELRSPLNAVLGLAHLLRQTALDDEQQLLINRLALAGDTLLRTINDVLDISKVEAGELILTHEPFDLAGVARDVVSMMSAQAQAKGLRLDLTMSPQLPRRVLGDAVRLTQVLTNLLANAIKFTTQGAVGLSVDWRNGQALLRVRDSGIGMDDATIERVFAPFVQADSTTTRRFGGTGLGLAIVKKLVELSGGEVSVRSGLGVGSEFLVEIPYQTVGTAAPVPAPVAADLARNALAGHTLLVVDDSDINREVARRILENKGATVVLAEDGEQALAALRGDGAAIGLVLMDLHLPRLDGVQATRRIRADEQSGGSRRHLPIIGLTAGATTGDREHALAAGMDEFVTKPFDPTRLLASIAYHLGLAVPVTSAPDTGPATSWPDIDGVDLPDVRARLGGDRQLFEKLLTRLLSTYTRIDIDDDALERVHRLRGAAGTLGITRLHAHASALEACLRHGSAASAAPLVAALNTELDRLRRACAALMHAAVPPRATPRATSPAAASAADVQRLVDLLRRHSLRAQDLFSTLAPSLYSQLGDSRFAALKDNIERLRFTEAARLLEAEASVF